VGTIYALMVGIDKYAGDELNDLHGCRNDIRAAIDVLERRRGPDTAVDIVSLLDGQATGAAIVAGFRTHLAKARDGDVALFWFSGHGSTFAVPPEFWHLEPDGRLETIVCADSRVDGRPELLDKELALLLDEVAAGGGHVVAVLDSCHSGGASRQSVNGRQSVTVRAARPAMRPPRYHLVPDFAERWAAGPPPVRHVLLAACQKEQKAAEEPLDGGDIRGRFSWALLRVLQRAGSATTYRELLTLARNEVESRSAVQRPLVYPPGPGPADRPIFGGDAIGDPPSIIMRHGPLGWEINAGTAHGVERELTQLAWEGRLVDVTHADAGRSRVAPVDWQPDRDRVYPVTVHRAARRTLFALTGLEPTGPAVPDDDPLVGITDPGEAELHLAAVAGGGACLTAIRDGEVIADLAHPPGPAQLHHIARWWRVRTLSNPGSRIADGVRLEVVVPEPGEEIVPRDRAATAPDPDGVLRLAYETRAGQAVPPGRFLRLRNTTSLPLYCVLLDLTERFKIDGGLFPFGRIEPGETAAAYEGRIVDFVLPAERAAVPGAAYRDWLMLIASTTEIDALPYELQPFQGIKDTAPRRPRRAEPAGDWWTTVLPVVTLSAG
jgi:hypothetical protein